MEKKMKLQQTDRFEEFITCCARIFIYVNSENVKHRKIMDECRANTTFLYRIQRLYFS